MGAGKSRLGALLAEKLGVGFVDTDARIVEQAGPIAEVFATAGEAAFREIEAAVVLQALGEALESGGVVALGGGAVEGDAVRAALAGFSPVVWLRAPADVLWERATHPASSGAPARPLATERGTFERLLLMRTPRYEEVATLTVDNDGARSASAVAETVAVALSACGAPSPHRAPLTRIPAKTPSKSYDVLLGTGCLAQFGEVMATCVPGGHVVVCSDENVAPLYLDRVATGLRRAGYEVSQVVLPAGERQKSLARAEELYGVLYDRGLRRRDTVVALGGGVIGDLTGFVAATFQRGVRLVQVPTTLLAQVDAAVGGKVAVDFRAGKNYVGTFYQPELVLVDVNTLSTLPERELRSGLAEVAKYGLLAGGEVLRRAEQVAGAGPAAGAVSEELVAGCIRCKLDVVRVDEREETGARAVLNLGHTIGHAIEAATGFARYTHGEAVGLGLRASLWLSERLTGLAPDEAERGQRLLDGLGLPDRLAGVGADAVAGLTARDKKAGAGGTGYVLLEGLGMPRSGVLVPKDLELEVAEWLLRR